jgi:hypothetical protein
VRNALILLTAVALLILIGGALNDEVVFDVDYVAGTATSVSLLWVAAVIAALVFVVGLIAAYLARTAVFGQRRKLEAELQTTYERLREAEALVSRPAPAPAPEMDAVAEAPAAETASGDATRVAPGVEAATMVDGDEAMTVVDGENDGEPADDGAATVVAGEAATAVLGADAAEAEVEATENAVDPDAEEAGEATAVTMVGDIPGEPDAAEAPPENVEDARAGDAGDERPAPAT